MKKKSKRKKSKNSPLLAEQTRGHKNKPTHILTPASRGSEALARTNPAVPAAAPAVSRVPEGLFVTSLFHKRTRQAPSGMLAGGMAGQTLPAGVAIKGNLGQGPGYSCAQQKIPSHGVPGTLRLPAGSQPGREAWCFLSIPWIFWSGSTDKSQHHLQELVSLHCHPETHTPNIQLGFLGGTASFQNPGLKS